MQRLNERLQELQKNCDEFREKVQEYEKNRAVQALKALATAAHEGDRTAKFFMEQIYQLKVGLASRVLLVPNVKVS